LVAVRARLVPWRDAPFRLQTCLGDVWHAHILFTGDQVTGLVDFGALRIDHVAVDLARLLGSMVGDAAELRAAGLRAYSCLRPLATDEEALVTVLDEAGTLLGVGNWIRWTYRERRAFEDASAVAERLAALVRRIQRWGAQAPVWPAKG
jgi:homoserine kinase type II